MSGLRLLAEFLDTRGVFFSTSSSKRECPHFSVCLRAPQRVEDSPEGRDSDGQISSLWPVNPGESCQVSDARILYAMKFFFFLEATGNQLSDT